jgi:8-oxo-dGTP pyrophosphatase MutT (NUDIX family)
MDASFINQLKEALQKPLPGRNAQFRMAHLARRGYAEAPPSARKAAVLALFYPKNTVWQLALIQRTSSNPNDQHSGQISFPGGRFDPHHDESLLHTALRETEEEIGIPKHQIQALGALTELYIPVSNFLVFPFVGFSSETPDFNLQATEVQSILEVPFSHFQHPDNCSVADVKVGGKLTLNNVPCFVLNHHIIWGATAMILSELLASLTD